MLLTGDHERAARAVADAVGIDQVVAGVLPAGKVEAVRDLQSQGRVVAMVGDGVNDAAAALAQADLGIAMGTGADAAIAAADLTLVRGDLRVAADAVRLSRRTLATIKGNLFWAFAYNVAALPARRRRVAQPDARRRRHGPVLGVRGHQQPPPAPLPLIVEWDSSDTLSGRTAQMERARVPTDVSKSRPTISRWRRGPGPVERSDRT